MTNSESKQAAIIEAWGEWWECIPDKTKEDTLEREGWSELDVLGNFDPADNPFISSDFDVSVRPTRHGNVAIVRPTFLAGIEDNNGFTRIESDGRNLPSASGWYEVSKQRGTPYVSFFNGRYFETITGRKTNGITHFKKWEPSKPPIY